MSGTLLFPCYVCTKMIALSVHVFESVHPFLWAVDSPICRSSLMLGTGRGGGLSEVLLYE